MATIQPQSLTLPPLRSLDDFIFSSARFQIPNLKDLEKWGNRVVKNLLYYQTNYLLMFVGIYFFMGVLNPSKVLCGICVKVVFTVMFLKFFTQNSALHQSTHHKWYYLGSTIFCGYLLLIWYDALLLSIFILLLPICVTFVHASLRLRNIRNKVANTIESFGPSTPMGMFLDLMNIKVSFVTRGQAMVT